MDIWETLYEKARGEYHPEDVTPFIHAHHVVCALESVDVYKRQALPWFGLAVVYYLLFELLWRRYKKQVDRVMAEV